MDFFAFYKLILIMRLGGKINKKGPLDGPKPEMYSLIAKRIGVLISD
jgi:hypothetical protein